jgi:ATP/maltotriose-dependent transcriptional regulator MalT
MASVLAGRFREAAEELDRAARLFFDAGNLLRAVSPRTVFGNMLAMTGAPEQGLSQVDEALGLARALGDPEDETYALISRALILSILGRHREALADAEKALRIAERLGHREWTCHALWAIGSIRRDAGDLDGAEPPLRRALELADNMPVHASWSGARLAQVLVARGDLEAAEPLVDRALAEALPGVLPEAYLARAELAAARGAPNAGAIAREALALTERMGYTVIVSRLRQLAQL